jgi:hypothetical protein
MSKKQQLVLKFPPLFTIDELKALYPDTPTITLRYKKDQAIQRGTIIQIGKLKNDLGRPTKIYAKSPADDTTKELAKKAGVIFEID